MDASYTVGSVIKLLQNYLDFRYSQEGGVAKLPEHVSYAKPAWRGELPFGQTRNDPSPWPFREPRHARTPMDGKGKAKRLELIWVSMLDLEIGLAQMEDADYDLLMRYYIHQVDTLEDLGSEFKVHPSTMQRRLQRIVQQLVRKMEDGNNVSETVNRPEPFRGIHRAPKRYS